MLSIFRTNQFIVNIFLLLYAALLHLSSFFVNTTAFVSKLSGGIFADWVIQLIDGNELLSDIAAILLLFGQAVLLNVFFADNRISRDYTLFPGLFYILVASIIPEFLILSPLLMANTFYLLAYRELFAVYRKPLAAANIFNAGFWIGIASLFYFSFSIFLLWGFMGLNIMRAFKLRERFMMLIGLLVPYILLGVYFFFKGRWAEFIQQQIIDNFAFWDIHLIDMPTFYIKLAFIGFLTLVALLSYSYYTGRRTIDVQKKIDIMYWGLLFGGLSLLVQTSPGLEHLLILSVPLGILLSLHFVQLSKSLAEALHFILFISVIILQLAEFFNIWG